MNILAIDDERPALLELVDTIEEVRPDAVVAAFRTADKALEHAQENPVDVAFLDINMKGMDGITLAKKLQELYPNVNIIFVTGFSEYAIDALKLYASGFVEKPYTADAVREQIEKLRHPPAGQQPGEVRQLGPYTFDHVAQRVYLDGEDTLLAPREYRLFNLLAGHPGKCFTQEEIFQKIWGDDPNGNAHTVSVHVSNLRKKLDLGADGHPTIKRQRGEGYYLEMAPPPGEQF